MKVTPSRLAISLAFISVSLIPQTYASSVIDSYQLYQGAVAQGDHERALSYAKAAFEQAQSVYVNQPDSLLNLNYNLALAYASAGNTEKAIEQFEHVIAFSESHFGDYHLRTVAAKLELANLYYNRVQGLHRNTEVRKYKTLARAVLTSLDEAEAAHPDDAAQLYFLVVTQLLGNDYSPLSLARSIKIVERGLSLAEAKWGERDTRTLDQAFMLGKRLFFAQDYSKAIVHLKRVTASLDSALDYSHPWSLQAHALLSESYTRTGNAELAAYHSEQIHQMTPWKDELEPMPLMRQRPAYPDTGSKIRDKVTVQVGFDLNEKGQVVNARVLDVEGSKFFGGSALDAVKHWRYAPKIKDGQAVSAQGLTVNVDFIDRTFFPLNNIDREFGLPRDERFDSAAYRVVEKDNSKSK